MAGKPSRQQADPGAGRVPVDGGGEHRSSHRPAGMLGSALAAFGARDAVGVRLLLGLHGARGAGKEKPAVRAPHRADTPPAFRLPGGGEVPAAPIDRGSRTGLLSGRRHAPVSAVLGGFAVHLPEHPTAPFARIRAAVPRASLSTARGTTRDRSIPCRSVRGGLWCAHNGRHSQDDQLAGTQPALLFAAAGWPWLPAPSLSIEQKAPERQASAFRHRRSTAEILVSLRFPKHQPNPQHRRRAGVCGSHQAIAGRLVRHLLRTPVPRSAAADLRQRRRCRRFRDRRVLEPGSADRRGGRSR